MNTFRRLYFIILFFGVFGGLSVYKAAPLAAQSVDADAMEVYLDFRYRGAIKTVIIAYYKDNEFFLPVNEVFEALQLDHQTKGMTVSGKFGERETRYLLDFAAGTLSHDKNTVAITSDDYLFSDLDFYLPPAYYSQLFGLDFSIDFNNLSLQLQTNERIPAVERVLREQKRKMAQSNRTNREKYELRYDRQRLPLDGGFMDYNLSGNINPGVNLYSFSTNMGLQAAGGDLQGSVFGSVSNNYTNINTNNLRWRYVIRDTPAVSYITLGQTQSDGVLSMPYTGLRVSNEPIEPRYDFDEFEVQGSTIPESEVELYLNNRLIDFQMADAVGNYRFLAPITYGSSQYDLKIYGPTGQIIERSSRIQIPFNFQPTGVFNYTVNAGVLDNPMMGSTKRNTNLQGSGSYGVNEWMTVRTGMEYYSGQNGNVPFFSGSASARLLTNYILTLEGVTNAYYRGALNVIYANTASINFDYFDYSKKINLYNSAGDDRRFSGNLYYPFQLGVVPLNIRLSTYSRIRSSGSTSTHRFDVNSNLGKLNLRLGYSAQTIGILNPFSNPTTGFIESSATYNISNNPNLPAFMRGFYTRAAMKYMVKTSRLESIDLSVSRNVLRQGRLQLSYGRNFIGGFNTLRFSLVIDFKSVRTGTTFSNIRNSAALTQNVRGSIGYDTNYNNFLFTSRDQVGRAAIAAKLFVDNDNDGMYNADIDDEIIAPAIRSDRTGATSVIKNGVLYMSQMQPYYYYNMEMNKSAVQNPMLVAELDKFGLITDPNRYKKIEIPFYMSGVISGTVQRLGQDDTRNGIGGLKLILQKKDNEYSQEIRTFSSGEFYAYEVPPGEYQLYVEGLQLDILQATSDPDTLNFRVRAIPDGDFIEGLDILLRPRVTEEVAEEPEVIAVPDTSTAEQDSAATGTTSRLDLDLEHSRMLGSNLQKMLRYLVLAQKEFYNQNFSLALQYVDKSLELYETSQAYGLKGSLFLLAGQEDLAKQNWDKAKKINPSIQIPDPKTLAGLFNENFLGKNERFTSN